MRFGASNRANKHIATAHGDNMTSHIRALESDRTGVRVVETRQRVGAYEGPLADVHRFNLQLSGRQKFISFEMERMLSSPPSMSGAGTVSFVPAYSRLSSITEGDDLHALRILIPKRLMGDTLGAMTCSGAADRELHGYFGPSSDRIHRVARLIYDELCAPGKGAQLMMDSLVQSLCVQLVRDLRIASGQAFKPSRSPDWDEERVLALVEDAIAGSRTLSDVASALGMKPYRLSRLFRQRFG